MSNDEEEMIRVYKEKILKEKEDIHKRVCDGRGKLPTNQWMDSYFLNFIKYTETKNEADYWDMMKSLDKDSQIHLLQALVINLFHQMVRLEDEISDNF